MGNITWPIVGFIITILFRLNQDRNTILDGKNVNHLLMNFICFFPLAFVVYGFAKASRLNWVESILISSGLVCSVWFLLFDFIFNKIRGLEWFWNGNQLGKKAAFTDRILRKIPAIWQLVLKVGLAALFITLYIAL